MHRSRSVPFAILLLFFIAGRSSAQAPPGATEHTYKSVAGTDLKLYVFSPAIAGAKRPGVVFFAGGGWTTLPANGGNAARARNVAIGGAVGITVTYRVRSQHNSTPYDAVADAKAAMRWVRGHATELGIDPSRIMVFGDSAGAHLALATATIPGFDDPGADLTISTRPDALFLMSAVVTTVAGDGEPLTEQQKQFAAMLGSRTREISPLHHLGSTLPPTLIVHGKADELMPFAMVDSFCAKARSLGSTCDLIAIENGPHNLNAAHRDQVNAAFEEFLRKMQYVK